MTNHKGGYSKTARLNYFKKNIYERIEDGKKLELELELELQKINERLIYIENNLNILKDLYSVLNILDDEKPFRMKLDWTSIDKPLGFLPTKDNDGLKTTECETNNIFTFEKFEECTEDIFTYEKSNDKEIEEKTKK